MKRTQSITVLVPAQAPQARFGGGTPTPVILTKSAQRIETAELACETRGPRVRNLMKAQWLAVAVGLHVRSSEICELAHPCRTAH